VRVERIGNATLYLGDCLEVLRTLPKADVVVRAVEPFRERSAGEAGASEARAMGSQAAAAKAARTTRAARIMTRG